MKHAKIHFILMTIATIVTIILFSAIVASAQTPNLINYQAVARNSSGNIMVNQPISVRLTIHDGSVSGTVLYKETQTLTTNVYGLFSVQIGGGVVISGSIGGVTWSSGTKYLQVEMDPAGGSTYVDMGTQQLITVPYAFYANKAASAASLTGNVTMSGDVTGTNSAATVVKLQGNNVSATAPIAGQVLSWSGAAWIPAAVGGTGTVTSITAGTGLSGGTITTSGTISMPNVGTAGTYGSATQVPVITTDAQGRVSSVTNTAITGDNWGSAVAHTDATLAGNGTIGTPLKIAQQSATTGQGLVWSGSTWAPATLPGITYTSGTGINIVGSVVNAQNTTALWNANELQGNNVSAIAPTTGDVLSWNGATWLPTASSSGWGLTGNAGTNPALNFVGTTDAQPLRFRVNNTWAGEINNSTINTSFGYHAGAFITTGTNNTGLGNEALSANSSGSYNTATGYRALYSNTVGTQNAAFGSQSLYSNTTGNYNTATGYASLITNTTGTENTANGFNSLGANTTGTDNTTIGSGSLRNNTTGLNNTAAGWHSLYANTTGNDNTASGYNSLHSNTTGYSNVAIGTNALYSDAANSNSVAIGDSAMYNQSVGAIGNTATGSKALFANVTGYFNTANGYQSLYHNTTANDNTAMGYQALTANTTGANNTASGYQSLYQNTTGGANTAIGNGALFNMTTGSDNTAIGFNSFPSSTTLTNWTAIGFNSGGAYSTSNSVELGNSSVATIRAQVTGITAISDRRIKDNVKANVPGLDFITLLRPVTYNLNIHRQNEILYKGKKGADQDWEGKYDVEKITMSGFIAQEVDQAAKDAGYDFSGVERPSTPDGLYGVRYTDFIMPLVKSVQELNAKNEEQQKIIDIQDKKINAQDQKIDVMQKQLTDLMKRLQHMEGDR